MVLSLVLSRSGCDRMISERESSRVSKLLSTTSDRGGSHEAAVDKRTPVHALRFIV